MAIWLWTRRLKRLLLPTFGRPIRHTLGREGGSEEGRSEVGLSEGGDWKEEEVKEEEEWKD